MSERRSTFYFVGVTPQHSAANQLFPLWAKALGLPDVVLRPVPVQLGAEAELRRVVDQMLADQECAGALITTHKVSLLECASDAFTNLTTDARWSGEVSAVRRQPDGLVGHATDPTASLRALDDLVAPATWPSRPELACIGTGGSARALLGGLARRGTAGGSAPEAVLLIGRRREPLMAVRECLTRARDGGPLPFELTDLLTEDPTVVADTVGALSARSVIVNATGLGKDRPGSPVDHRVRYPQEAVIWDFNYRGDLTFLHQAASQRAERSLRLADGWSYFVHGWFEVLSFVFELEPTEHLRETFSRTTGAAGIKRPFAHLDAA